MTFRPVFFIAPDSPAVFEASRTTSRGRLIPSTTILSYKNAILPPFPTVVKYCSDCVYNTRSMLSLRGPWCSHDTIGKLQAFFYRNEQYRRQTNCFFLSLRWFKDMSENCGVRKGEDVPVLAHLMKTGAKEWCEKYTAKETGADAQVIHST